MPQFDKKTLLRIFSVALGCIVLYWLLHETERVKVFLSVVYNIFAPFLFGGVLAFILNVPMRGIENSILKRIQKPVLKRALSVVITILALLLVLLLVFWLLIPQVINAVNSLVAALPEFSAKSQNVISGFLNDHPKIQDWLKEYTEFTSWSSMVDKALQVFGNNVSAIFNGAVSAIGGVFSGMFDAMIALVFSVYCLFQKETLARQGRKLLYAFLKENIADKIVRIFRLANATFSNFLSGQCVEVCILACLFAICMSIFRMPYIPLICVVIAITAFIPIIGAWAGCIVGAFLIMVKSPMLAVLFVIIFVILQLIENNVIYPRVVGTSVGLSGMWVLVAVTIGGELMGVFGMFLMIPVVSVLYTLLQEITNKKLAISTVAPDKLQPQPPERVSKFKEKHKNKAKKSKKINQEDINE